MLKHTVTFFSTKNYSLKTTFYVKAVYCTKKNTRSIEREWKLCARFWFQSLFFALFWCFIALDWAPAAGPTPHLCVVLFFQNAANGLLLPDKEEFARAPVEIGSPSILLAPVLPKCPPHGMYLHLFAKAEHVLRRVEPALGTHSHVRGRGFVPRLDSLIAFRCLISGCPAPVEPLSCQWPPPFLHRDLQRLLQS